MYVPHILGTVGMIDDGQDGVLQIRLQGPETAYYAGLSNPPTLLHTCTYSTYLLRE